jgi:hypothetical protein
LDLALLMHEATAIGFAGMLTDLFLLEHVLFQVGFASAAHLSSPILRSMIVAVVRGACFRSGRQCFPVGRIGTSSSSAIYRLQCIVLSCTVPFVVGVRS